LYAIYANPVHVHFLVSRSLDISEMELATNIVESSERFIKTNKLASGDFCWQETASAFSVSKSDVDKVCKYILNQKEHHRKVSFTEEYELFIQHYKQNLAKNKVIRL
jgi:putative transposase